ncbi:hypothetical protein MCOR02_001516 [Pyricularia oryzae]|nr:hypothetical protein MCOR02_001516 [Pyricularia oryzae]
MPLKIVGYDELYGWTMDQVVETVGKKGNCTYCGIFRRQALDRGAKVLDIKHVVTGHNADDVAETVLMNLLRGDLARLSRSTNIMTGANSALSDNVKRSKPLKYAYEKEIVLYAHHKKLDYFSTECLYSPEAFRGSARSLIKNLEKVRPSAILDIVRSGEDMARLVPSEISGSSCACNGEGEATQEYPEGEPGGCGSANGRSSGGEMAEMEARLRKNQDSAALEVDVGALENQKKDADAQRTMRVPIRNAPAKGKGGTVTRQVLGTCIRCGYMSSQAICQACTLLDGLNKNRPQIQVGDTN